LTQVIVAESLLEHSQKSAEQVNLQLSGVASPVVFFPTGSTPMGMYRELSSTLKNPNVDWTNATVFALDEYLGIKRQDHESFRNQLWEAAAKPLGLKPSQLVTPDCETVNPINEARNYESQIESHPRVSLAVLGVGRNGHLAFNEPGTPIDSLTHVAELTDQTRTDNSEFFQNREVPRRAITMGLSTIMRAEAIMVLALGVKKSRAIESLLTGAWDPDWPISALTTHENVIVIIDKECGKGLGIG
jgi:glucosamine-6-phosphate deaminase